METEHANAVAEHDPKAVTVVVTVNNRSVTFQERHVTGAQIKETAIQQGVPIQIDFALFEEKGPKNLKQIGDAEKVSLHQDQRFKAVAPDDNS